MSTAPSERPVGPPSRSAVDAGAEWLETHEYPRPDAEEWRYSPLDQIIEALNAAVPAPAVAVEQESFDRLTASRDEPVIVFCNGWLDPILSRLDDLPQGISVEQGQQIEVEEQPGVWVREPADAFEALNQMACRDLAVIRTRRGADVGLIHIVHLVAPGRQRAATHPRTLIHVSAESHLQLLETYVGLPEPAFTNAVTIAHVGDRATLALQRHQLESTSVTHVGRTVVSLDEAAAVTLRTVDLGADTSHLSVDVTFRGERSAVDLSGLRVPAAGQTHDIVATVDHAVSECTSTQSFRGVVADGGRGSFTGHVVVRADTIGTNASQIDRNVLLSPSARADTRPWLEIYSDRVRCTHGAAVGQLDDEAIFYLRSRGLAESEARALLVMGFIAQTLDSVEPPSRREQLRFAIAANTRGGQR